MFGSRNQTSPGGSCPDLQTERVRDRPPSILKSKAAKNNDSIQLLSFKVGKKTAKVLRRRCWEIKERVCDSRRGGVYTGWLMGLVMEGSTSWRPMRCCFFLGPLKCESVSLAPLLSVCGSNWGASRGLLSPDETDNHNWSGFVSVCLRSGPNHSEEFPRAAASALCVIHHLQFHLSFPPI